MGSEPARTGDYDGLFGLVPSLMALQIALHSCSAVAQPLLHVLMQEDCCCGLPGKSDRQSSRHCTLHDCLAALQV